MTELLIEIVFVPLVAFITQYVKKNTKIDGKVVILAISLLA
jgi:hypothetical protein